MDSKISQLDKRADDEAQPNPKKQKRMTTESLLTVNKNRFVLFPIKHRPICQMVCLVYIISNIVFQYKKHEASFWTAEEIDLSQDRKDWESLTDNDRHFIKHILGTQPSVIFIVIFFFIIFCPCSSVVFIAELISRTNKMISNL